MVNAWVPTAPLGLRRLAALWQGPHRSSDSRYIAEAAPALPMLQGLVTGTAMQIQGPAIEPPVRPSKRWGSLAGFQIVWPFLLLLGGCGPHDCWQLNPYNCGYNSAYSPGYAMPAPSYIPGAAYSDTSIPMGGGTIMQGGRATGYYSTFGNQTTIIQPGQAPVYIDAY